ncbi:MAG: hypothetical protein B6D39_06545 [Anaerolineae bacterium UTCFX2]|jgi:uncharacterized membrane protein (DUF4010 family)|nr:DUF4010 domain-containing protein [Anaerolineae bacterium]MCZ7552518.1 DUF4010 domain-containing protein [Anaerolineales bacterium]OQY91605.1 MAG: hypothetical protein B6D39_06545 [Anaerolineae bacterium UTCFX2]
MNIADVQWPYRIIFERLILALALGLFIGFERQRREKEAGVRTFSFAAILGAIGGLLGEAYAIASIALIGLIIVIMNIELLRTNREAVLTTSTALATTVFIGVLCGLGHTFTPVAIGVVTAALLAWKEPLANFSIKLTEAEIRSAILLGILAFVIYPILPKGTVDPWRTIDLQAAWISVILIAGIGFINYILLKAYGDRGIELSGFLGGFVNSDVAARELAQRSHEMHGQLSDSAYRGILLTNAGMIIRNAVLLAIFNLPALFIALPGFGLMLAATAAVAFMGQKPAAKPENLPENPITAMNSPFSLRYVLVFGMVMLIVQVAGVIAERLAGSAGMYMTSFVGSLFSSASTVVAVATLASRGNITSQVAAVCALIAAITSDVGTIPYVVGLVDQRQFSKMVAALLVVAFAGVLGGGLALWYLAR